jgi:RNA polymerase-binding transcription factor DksA
MALNRRDLIQLASQLEERAEALRVEIHREVERGRQETFAEVAGTTHDAGDEALASLVADLDNAEVTRDLEELRGLEAARRRVADGSYGLCADCGTDIPLARLHAQPGAARCAECQARHEKTYRK